MDSSIAFTLGPITVKWYGILIALAFAIGAYLAYREALRQKLNPDHLLNLLLIIIPASIIGARLYYVIMRWDYYSQHLDLILKTWTGGMAIHGGIIAACLGMLLYCHIKKTPFLRWTDVLAPSLALGQAIGRWGNYLNQEAYGIETDLPWAIMINGVGHHPTFLYESLWDFLIFIALMWLIRRPHRSGNIFASYLIFYSVGRFFIEMLRTDSLMLGPFRVAMLVSGLGVVLGAVILYYIRRQPLLDFSAVNASRQVQRAKQRDLAKKQNSSTAETPPATKKKNTTTDQRQ